MKPVLLAVCGLVFWSPSVLACPRCASSGSAAVHAAPLAVGTAAPAVRVSRPVLPPIAPPPGTIGETYTRPSHPVPEDEHPRTAMLAVRDHRAVKYLRVQRMGGFRMENGIWLFESERPLFPGQEQIVRVEARREPNDVEPYQVKFVRLIPGRIVYLDFCTAD